MFGCASVRETVFGLTFSARANSFCVCHGRPAQGSPLPFTTGSPLPLLGPNSLHFGSDHGWPSQGCHVGQGAGNRRIQLGRDHRLQPRVQVGWRRALDHVGDSDGRLEILVDLPQRISRLAYYVIGFMYESPRRRAAAARPSQARRLSAKRDGGSTARAPGASHRHSYACRNGGPVRRQTTSSGALNVWSRASVSERVLTVMSAIGLAVMPNERGVSGASRSL